MIAVLNRGRLGNNMFQFAFGLAAARRLGTTFVMDDRLLASLFVLRPHDGLAARLRRSLGFRVRRRFAPLPVLNVDPVAEPPAVLAALEDGRAYSGYFQSEAFFADAVADVRAAYALRPEHTTAFERRYGDLLGSPYVCCHVRATDYHAFDGGVVLPPAYYLDALARIAPAPGTPIVFVGDDLTGVRDALGDSGMRFEQDAEAVDLQLMINAAAVVTSNSSFGWWGAWLGERPGREVVAPRHWLGFKRGFESPPGVVPARWLQLDV